MQAAHESGIAQVSTPAFAPLCAFPPSHASSSAAHPLFVHLERAKIGQFAPCGECRPLVLWARKLESNYSVAPHYLVRTRNSHVASNTRVVDRRRRAALGLPRCQSATRPVGLQKPAALINALGITATDISNGVDASSEGPRTISATGVILGRQGAQATSLRGWWQAPAAAFTVIDNGHVQGGNRNADAGGDQASAILSTNGGSPWSSIARIRMNVSVVLTSNPQPSTV